MVALNPYLNFDGTARQAMELYGRVLGAEPQIMTFGSMPGTPAGAEDLVMHAAVVNDSGLMVYASDSVPGQPSFFGENGTIAVSGPEAEEQQGYWDRLAEAEGTEVLEPLTDTPWGARFGVLRDPFGVLWLFNIGE